MTRYVCQTCGLTVEDEQNSEDHGTVCGPMKLEISHGNATVKKGKFDELDLMEQFVKSIGHLIVAYLDKLTPEQMIRALTCQSYNVLLTAKGIKVAQVPDNYKNWVHVTMNKIARDGMTATALVQQKEDQQTSN